MHRRPEVRLLTLTGTGGVGKTRLALQVATDVLDAFPDGICFVPLASVSDPQLVVPTIAHTLGLRDTAEWSLGERLFLRLREQHLLLLLDNFEQVLSAAPELASLLSGCPQLKILITSRAALHVRGEYEYLVTPLALPPLQGLEEGEVLEQYSAIALFLERVHAILPDFQVTPENIRCIAEICCRLDGLPLAIELAASRSKLFPPHILLARLEHRLAVLTAAAQDMPVRQRTLRNTLDWSYQLLTAEEQQLFRKLAVFAGGCSLEAAERVCQAGDPASHGTYSVVDGIASLIDKSLLQHTEQEAQEPRVRMLETVREYGLECLHTHREVEETQRAHALYYLTLAREAETKLTTQEQKRWLEQLEQEQENLRGALQWLVEHQESALALTLGSALYRFWWMRGHFSEGLALLEWALARSDEVTPLIRAQGLLGAGILATQQGSYGQAERRCRESLALFRELGDLRGSATSLWMLGHIAMMRSRTAVAKSLAQEALALSRQVNDTWCMASALDVLAGVAEGEGAYEHACLLVEEGLVLIRQAGDGWTMAHLLWVLGLMTLSLGDIGKAHALFTESLELSRQVGNKRSMAYSLSFLGYVACFQGEYVTGRSLLEEGLTHTKLLGDRRGMIYAFFGLGRLAARQGDFAMAQTHYEACVLTHMTLDYTFAGSLALTLEGLGSVASRQGLSAWAARLWGAAEMVRETYQMPRQPVGQAAYERRIATTRAQMGEEAFTTAWAEGHSMTLKQVLEAQGAVRMPLGTPDVSSLSPVGPAPTYPAGLTAREVEVLRLLATGITSAQIAERLIISVLTVNGHIRSIYSKLGVTSRSAATRYAFEQKLV